MKNWTPKEIEEFRKAQGLTLKELGELTGVALNTVYRWEKGIITPSMTAKILLFKLEEGFTKPKRRGGEKRHGKNKRTL
jgi:transcriptional regulator with XRE-family HTH domain